MGYLEKKLQAVVSTINQWTLKTGQLYEMTSDSLPSPFTCSRSAVGSVALTGNTYDAFNSNASAPRGQYASNGEGVVYTINFNVDDKYRPSEIAWDYYSGNTINLTLTITGYYADDSTVTLKSANTTAQYNSGTQSLSLTEALSKITISLIKTGGLDDSIYVKYCQVTEWYEKG